MTPMTFEEWCAAEGAGLDHNRRQERYRTYVAGVLFIRSQIGGLPPVAERMARPVYGRTSFDRASAGA